MAVRNFWIEADIDGRQSTLAGGPRNKNDGMEIDIYQRDDGTIYHAVDIWCHVDPEGNLVTQIHNRQNDDITEVITRR